MREEPMVALCPKCGSPDIISQEIDVTYYTISFCRYDGGAIQRVDIDSAGDPSPESLHQFCCWLLRRVGVEITPAMEAKLPAEFLCDRCQHEFNEPNFEPLRPKRPKTQPTPKGSDVVAYDVSPIMGIIG